MDILNNYKKCTKCKENKFESDEYFYTQKTTTKKYGVRYVLTSWCRSCINEKQVIYRNEHIEKCRARELEYYHADPVRREVKKAGYRKHAKENRDVYAERLSKWQEENKEKVIEHSRYREMHKKHEVSNLEWEKCKNYFHYRCCYCDIPIENHIVKYNKKYINGDFHKDHTDHFGSNGLENCTPSCKSCNTSKHNIDLDVWYSEGNEHFLSERLNKINIWLNEDYKKYLDISK